MYAELREAWGELTGPGGQFEIVETRVRGIPYRCYANAPPTLRDFWLATEAFAERDYLVYEDERWTYARAHADVASVATWLRQQGVQHGDRVAIAMRNYPEWMLAYWATTSIGAVVVGMNAWWVPGEMAYGLKDSIPKVLIADHERLERARSEPAMLDGIVVVGVRTQDDEAVTSWETITATKADRVPEAEIDPDDDACIFYTSGTTGYPKGAQQTHRGCVHNVVSLGFSGAVFALALNKAHGTPLPDPDDPVIPSVLLTTPLFHVTANNCAAQASTAAGGKLVHMYRWDPGEALRLIEREQIRSMSGVPTMARELLNHPDFDKRDTSSLLALSGGGAQLPPDLVGRIHRKSGAAPGTGWGMTETCGIITSLSGEFFLDKPDSVGPVMPVYEAKCVDDDGNDLPQGEMGEIWVRGPHVIKGYLNREDATAESITDGWLHTGDIARIDEDGFVFIMDRVKDMVLRGGENVYCAEVENAFYQHADVAECSAFSVPDERLGEEVGTAVHLQPGSTLTPDDLREHCASHIARHKIPRYLWILKDPLPRNANGKFLRRELRDRLDLVDAR